MGIFDYVVYFLIIIEIRKNIQAYKYIHLIVKYEKETQFFKKSSSIIN